VLELFDVVTDHSTRLVIDQRGYAPSEKGAFPLHNLELEKILIKEEWEDLNHWKVLNCLTWQLTTTDAAGVLSSAGASLGDKGVFLLH
jgi:hypothetical protein